MKPIALDLFCCAGGAGEGLRQAGFDVIGVDIEHQPNYRAGRFVQADALAILESIGGDGISNDGAICDAFRCDGEDVEPIAFIWTSPPRARAAPRTSGDQITSNRSTPTA